MPSLYAAASALPVSHSRMRTILVVLLLLATLAAAGCSSEDEAAPTATLATTAAAASPSTTRTGPTTPTRSVTPTSEGQIPDVAGLHVGRATAALTEIGLEVRRLDVLGTACLPRGQVLDQRPRPGTKIVAGRRITLEMNAGALGQCGLGAPAASPELDRVARLFETFAHDPLAGPPSDTPVALYLGGHQRKVVAHADWKRPAAWRLCPPGGYAGRTCSFSAVDLIRSHIGPLATTPLAPEHNCAHPKPLAAADAGGTHSVTLTPDEQLDCTSYWGVQLIVNDVGQVVAVNVVIAEP